MNESELMALTKEQLQDHLRAAGQAVSGKVDELRARLKSIVLPTPEAEAAKAAAAAAEADLAAQSLALAEQAKAGATAMPVIHCPGCKRTTLDRLYPNSQVQAVTCYATQRYPSFRIRYCACRACGRRWTERGK